ncbi:helix-turn-helix domain-containing protein [Embleya sp. NPDC008237]|uniref:helix-turn-helix domain-containing protein n=1 Tax=Embleya sp. NPDC008237 TaxID=3363978 RepID=UPI0036F02398
MPRWQELPDSLDQRVRQLVVQLRRLKDRSGLSLVSLAAKTGYSRSSWERCLNGRTLPPRRAVEELARITGADPVRLLVLHEVAERAWRRPTALIAPTVPTAPDAAKDEDASGVRAEGATEDSGAPKGTAVSVPGPGSEPEAADEPVAAARPPGVRGPVVLAAVVTAALVGVGIGMQIAQPRHHHDDGRRDRVATGVGTPGPRPTGSATTGSSPTAAAGPGRYVFQPGKSYPCEVRGTGSADGGLSAGYSATRTAVLAGPGWDVVEAQCLLSRRGMDPGIVDGVYGQQTIAAVLRLQKEAGLPPDGVVGPHTWQVLRG